MLHAWAPTWAPEAYALKLMLSTLEPGGLAGLLGLLSLAPPLLVK
jgi:hypothetical protein